MQACYSLQALVHLDFSGGLAVVQEVFLVISPVASDGINSLDYLDADLVPVGSLDGGEVGNEEEEVAARGRDPRSEDWNLFEGWQVEAEHKDASWHAATLHQYVVRQHAVLDTESSQEALQHGSDVVQENVEDPELIHRQDRVLHVHVIGYRIEEESHENLKAHAQGNCEQDLDDKHRSVVVLGRSYVCAADFLSYEGSSC